MKTLLGLCTLGIMLLPTVAQAEMKDGYAGVSTTTDFGDGTNLEVMLPITDYAQIRGTTDFTNEVDVVPTLSTELGTAGDLYTGLGWSQLEGDSYLLWRTGIDWNISEDVVGITYVDYANDEVTGTIGLGYRF